MDNQQVITRSNINQVTRGMEIRLSMPVGFVEVTKQNMREYLDFYGEEVTVRVWQKVDKLLYIYVEKLAEPKPKKVEQEQLGLGI